MTPATGEMFLEIGGHEGDLGFLAADASNPQGLGPGVAYVRPELAPDRLEAYGGCAMILLSTGAERMSDGAVRALRLYVQNGGLLVFTGGTVTPILSDGRWSGLFPAQPGPPVMLRSDSVLRELTPRIGNSSKTPRVGSAYSVLTSKPLDGAGVMKDGDVDVVTAKPYGRGMAVFWAFDPLTDPIRSWSGLQGFFQRSAHTPVVGQDPHVSLPSDDNQVDPRMGMSYSSYSLRPYDDGIPGQEEAFHVTLPTAQKVGEILGLYLLFVIPINFIVLQLIKRRQWGWFTGTFISVVFAGIMLSQSKDLYGLKTSHSDRAVVVGQEGSDALVVTGQSQMFASSAGEYDLKWSGLDSIAPIEQYSYGSDGTDQGIVPFDPIDTGAMQVPAAKFSNLNFQQLWFTQILDQPDLVSLAKTGDGYSVATSRNLENVVFVQHNHGPMMFLGNLTKGAHNLASITDKSPNTASPELSNLLTQVLNWLPKGNWAIVANAPGLPIGPDLGDRLKPDPILVYFGSLPK